MATVNATGTLADKEVQRPSQESEDPSLDPATGADWEQLPQSRMEDTAEEQQAAGRPDDHQRIQGQSSNTKVAPSQGRECQQVTDKQAMAKAQQLVDNGYSGADVSPDQGTMIGGQVDGADDETDEQPHAETQGNDKTEFATDTHGHASSTRSGTKSNKATGDSSKQNVPGDSQQGNDNKVEQHDGTKGTEEGEQKAGNLLYTADDMPATTLEQGRCYFFFRPKVNVGEHPASFDDSARFYMIMAPTARHTGDIKVGARLAVIGKKRLPRADKKERFFAFVEAVADSTAELVNARMGSTEYQTKTQGGRHSPAARSLGEAVYSISLKSDQHTHLLYKLEVPAEGPGEVQQAFGIEQEGSMVIMIKNPEGFSPPNAGLRDKAQLPRDKQEEFKRTKAMNKGYAWIKAEDPSLLDFPHVEFLLIGVRDGFEDEIPEDAQHLNEVAADDVEDKLHSAGDVGGQDCTKQLADGEPDLKSSPQGAPDIRSFLKDEEGTQGKRKAEDGDVDGEQASNPILVKRMKEELGIDAASAKDSDGNVSKEQSKGAKQQQGSVANVVTVPAIDGHFA